MTAAFKSYLAPGDAMTVNLSTVRSDPRELAFGRFGYDLPVEPTASESGNGPA